MKERRDLLQSEDNVPPEQAERAWRRAASLYQMLYNVIDEGFCIIEIFYDEHGKPFDLRYLDANQAFIKQTGISSPDRETFRQALEVGPDLLDRYAEVVRTGEPTRFTFQMPSTERWYEQYVARIGKPEEHQLTLLLNDITERKHAEAALRESEAQVRRTAELNAFRIKLADALRRLTDPLQIQSTAMRVLGEYLQVSRVLYDEIDEATGTTVIHDNYVREGVPKIVGRFSHSGFGGSNEKLRTGRTVIYTDVNTEPDLSPEERAALLAAGVVSTIGVPLIKNGHWVASMGVQHAQPRNWTNDEIALVEEVGERTWADVERARAEAALRESEAQVQKALSIQTVGVLFFRLDGRITDANDTFVRMSGYSCEELQSMADWGVLTPPEFMDVTSRAARELAETGETEPYEKQFFRKDGSRWWGLFAPTRLAGEGLDSECVEFIVDVTERKQAEEALQGHRATLQSFYDSAPFLMGIAELNGDQIVAVSGNRAATEFFATDPLALPGKTGTVLGNSEDFEQLWAGKYRRSQETGKPVQFDYEHLRPGGSLWLRATVAFLGHGPAGHPRFSFVVEDITRGKRAEYALRESEKQLRLLNETLEQKVQEKTAEVRHLASDLIKATQRERQRISHVLHDDLQQRIYAIQMQLSFLQDAWKGDHDSVPQETSQIKRQLEEILKITRDLSIDLSPPILREEGLSHAIQWLAARMKHQYGLSIELQAEGSFAIHNEDLHVFLFNCVRELLFNVVKHAEASRVVVRLEWKDAHLWIEVRDDGKGFSFDPNDRRSAEAALPPSLGLPTIHHQLGLFSGSLEIHSAPGEGTRVTLSVPVTDAVQSKSSPTDAL